MCELRWSNVLMDARGQPGHRSQRTPDVVDVGRQRARLNKRLEQIKKHNLWGDMPDAEYLAERDAIRAALAALPDSDRIRSFDA